MVSGLGEHSYGFAWQLLVSVQYFIYFTLIYSYLHSFYKGFQCAFSLPQNTILLHPIQVSIYSKQNQPHTKGIILFCVLSLDVKHTIDSIESLLVQSIHSLLWKFISRVQCGQGLLSSFIAGVMDLNSREFWLIRAPMCIRTCIKFSFKVESNRKLYGLVDQLFDAELLQRQLTRIAQFNVTQQTQITQEKSKPQVIPKRTGPIVKQVNCEG